MIFMPRHSPPDFAERSLRRGVHCFLAIILLGVLPRSSTADLFYKVEKVIKLTESGLNPGADGGPPISVTGLNDAGSFVGYFPSADNNKLHAFLYDNGGQGFIDLNAFLNADSSMATCLDGGGIVFGIYWPNDGTYIPGGFFYIGGGEMHTFASPAGSYGIQAVTAVNALDSVIGTYLASDFTTHGFILQESTYNPNFTDLGVIDGYSSYLWPVAINDEDQVIGNAYTEGPYSDSVPFFWDDGTLRLVDVFTLTSGSSSVVAMNNSGHAVGFYTAYNDSNPPQAITRSFFWDGDAVTDLGTLSDFGAGVCALTDSDFVVGVS